MRINVCWFTTLASCLLLCAMVSLAGDGHKKVKGKPDSVAAMSSRALACRYDNTSVIQVWTVAPFEDNDGEEAVLVIAEMSDGGLGLYVARGKEDRDEWITLTKQNVRCEMFSEALKRSKSR